MCSKARLLTWAGGQSKAGWGTYRCADYKEHVIDLIVRVVSVSVETVAMKAARR